MDQTPRCRTANNSLTSSPSSTQARAKAEASPITREGLRSRPPSIKLWSQMRKISPEIKIFIRLTNYLNKEAQLKNLRLLRKKSRGISRPKSRKIWRIWMRWGPLGAKWEEVWSFSLSILNTQVALKCSISSRFSSRFRSLRMRISLLGEMTQEIQPGIFRYLARARIQPILSLVQSLLRSKKKYCRCLSL